MNLTDVPDKIEALTKANKECLERTVPLLRMLGSCRNQFHLYAVSHRAKGTEDSDQKAATNESFVAEIDKIITDFRERAPTQNEENNEG
jgi:hypothetical protein